MFKGNLRFRYLRPRAFCSQKADILAGLQVALLALPLSIGIGLASGFPAAAGLLAAIIGGLIVSFLGSGRVSIHGPAAGLIVVILFGVERLGQGDFLKGYQLTLGAIVCAGVLQMILSILRAGRLSLLFPETVVHAMLSAIGIIITLKQFPLLLGTQAESKELFPLFLEIPQILMRTNPSVAFIGFLCLSILVIWPRIKSPVLKAFPAPIFVVCFGIYGASALDFATPHMVWGHKFHFGSDLYVPMPTNFWSGLSSPVFSSILNWNFALTVISITIVASLETLLSSAAIDQLDPLRRKTNLNRDLFAVGFGTTISGLLGGLPMISEIVRSSANINAGARNKSADFVHGLALLIAVLILAPYIKAIPLSALAALLIYTGYRLASPQELFKVKQIGRDQLIIYVFTITCILATDLLVGVIGGVFLKTLLHIARGVSIRDLFHVQIRLVKNADRSYHLMVHSPLVFTNLASVISTLSTIPLGNAVTLDLKSCSLIDHTCLHRLHQIKSDRELNRGALTIIYDENHQPVADHLFSVRRLRKFDRKRIVNM